MITIDWVSFTPLSALLGGVMIGGAAGLLMLLNGRIAGISGILGGLLGGNRRDAGWRLAFLAGLLLAPWLWMLVATLPAAVIEADYATLVVAGLLVGVGTRYGSGCTSGHGVCGLSRLSPRSLIATLSFMAAGFGTVYLIRHVVGG
ncbi:YeeE/YedE family protein [Marinobacter xestospongiae]|uniref:YeeE/YedE family protein n=1 Tax=Marinobacter xestospongiae TaxID=994319 RepID=A0ABU3VZZ8_9GAMM|nr:YeeE/YedE family protein [Marinobacter xestospongiae]MDV2079867.1 YeeE/YedE family protein [Marinobacter xestospongiae]